MSAIDFLAISIIIGSWVFQIKNPQFVSLDFPKLKNLVPYTREFDMES